MLELNDLSIEDKSLIVMFVLTLLREHRESQKIHDRLTLRHLTVVEEATMCSRMCSQRAVPMGVLRILGIRPSKHSRTCYRKFALLERG